MGNPIFPTFPDFKVTIVAIDSYTNLSQKPFIRSTPETWCERWFLVLPGSSREGSLNWGIFLAQEFYPDPSHWPNVKEDMLLKDFSTLISKTDKEAQVLIDTIELSRGLRCKSFSQMREEGIPQSEQLEIYSQASQNWWKAFYNDQLCWALISVAWSDTTYLI